ncbi:hypothetical protein [Marinibactrum halimedae]|uniref:Lipoprotein n=1 Tax=Marinibactrum halimedae TaxID=1444977 RepID=A0AA37T1C4_9GAMM|nr:hypothetical protein [Marinibactrum halimedae]MCD9460720.1 hypothetical protein [Marinibactrum halimedae]GLS25154.1 hypothetical protein GCM10007877_08680 [Marinibactrum halimedae]
MKLHEAIQNYSIPRLSTITFSFMLVIALTACGGGGGGGSDSGNNNRSQGETTTSTPPSSTQPSSTPPSSGSDTNTINEEDTISDSDNNADNNIDSEVAPEEEAEGTAGITVPESFTFNEAEKLNVSLSASELAYVSVCNTKEDEYTMLLTIDYQQCLFRSWIRTKTFQADINLPPHTHTLMAAVLIPKESVTPVLYEWQRQSGLSWEIQ